VCIANYRLLLTLDEFVLTIEYLGIFIGLSEKGYYLSYGYFTVQEKQ
jgi:hypothetical protein